MLAGPAVPVETVVQAEDPVYFATVKSAGSAPEGTSAGRNVNVALQLAKTMPVLDSVQYRPRERAGTRGEELIAGCWNGIALARSEPATVTEEKCHVDRCVSSG